MEEQEVLDHTIFERFDKSTQWNLKRNEKEISISCHQYKNMRTVTNIMRNNTLLK